MVFCSRPKPLVTWWRQVVPFLIPGSCHCGKCLCSAEEWYISGEFCDCDDRDCDKHDGLICTGAVSTDPNRSVSVGSGDHTRRALPLTAGQESVLVIKTYCSLKVTTEGERHWCPNPEECTRIKPNDMAVGKLSQSNPSPLFTQKRENNGLENHFTLNQM